MALEPEHPDKVFRYLRDRDHARALVNGYVWFTTLEALRNNDHPRSDPGEGTYRLDIKRYDSAVAGAETEKLKGRLAGLFRMEGSARMVVENIVYAQKVPDLFVMCTSSLNSKFLRRLFGEHCVRITDPQGFALTCCRAIANHLGERAGGRCGRMQYQGRGGVDAQGPDANHLAFMNINGHASEKEYRMIWGPMNQHPSRTLQPVLLRVPGVERFVSIVDDGGR